MSCELIDKHLENTSKFHSLKQKQPGPRSCHKSQKLPQSRKDPKNIILIFNYLRLGAYYITNRNCLNSNILFLAD